MKKRMDDYVRAKCIKCDTVIHVSTEDAPSVFKTGDLIERFCPGCDDAGYMELS